MPNPKETKALTPMLRQYLEIKSQYPDTILFFRLGDFYEMFYEDAEIASKILEITLTSRNSKDPNPIPLCGVPYHSMEPYLSKLLQNGKKVAICEQVEDPKQAKGIVKREVTRVFTPGLIADGLGLDALSHNFIVSLCTMDTHIGLSVADISTSFFQATQFSSIQQVCDELSRLNPKEVVLAQTIDTQSELYLKLIARFPNTMISHVNLLDGASLQLQELSGYLELESQMPVAAHAAKLLYHYIVDTQKGKTESLFHINGYQLNDRLCVDESTSRNLELCATMIENKKQGSVLHAIDQTYTSLGSRKLRSFLLYPLMDPLQINQRLDAVDELLKNRHLMVQLPDLLKDIYDIERICSRIAIGSANARDVIALSQSLKSCHKIKQAINDSAVSGVLAILHDTICDFSEIIQLIDQSIVSDPPISLRDGGVIESGINADLDELKELMSQGKQFIAKLESSERKKTGISSLKIRYNRVFGYYLEVTHLHKDKVPDHYIRKQTLSNAERYITEELKTYEERVIGAKDKAKVLEYDLFVLIRNNLQTWVPHILSAADAIAQIDVFLAFAANAAQYNYCRPEVDGSGYIDICEGRHPIIERLCTSERFIPNDVRLDDTDSQIMMITGPNMAGKSTIMRQTALIVLLAQIGSYVPAKSAHIGVVDRIFTRVGASDALSKGQSTFMVEMAEAATILNEASNRSLIIIDEIGRGTSTFDGLAIAWSIAEHLHDHIGARTMFATHYHELTDLATTKPGIRNMQIAIKEWAGEIVFLRKLIAGGTSRSYGIEVAKLAGLPKTVISRANEVLYNLESTELDEIGQPRLAAHQDTADHASMVQCQLFDHVPDSKIVGRINDIDTSAMTPLEALNVLHELKQLL